MSRRSLVVESSCFSVSVLALISVLQWSAEAQATTVLNNPYGNVAVQAWVNSDPGTGANWVTWIRVSDGDCTYKDWLGDGHVNGDYEIHGGSGNDLLVIIPAGYSYTLCNNTANPPVLNGVFIDLYGGAGNDNLWTGDVDSALQGEGDGDILVTDNEEALAYGGDGPDVIKVGSSVPSLTRSEWDIEGGAGNDCIMVDPSATRGYETCGAGTDTWSGPGTRPSDCESNNAGSSSFPNGCCSPFCY